MNINKTLKIIGVAAVMLVGLIHGAAGQSQTSAVTISSGSDGCAGAYYAYAKMTNSSGTFWIVPPAGTHTGTFTNASGLAFPSSLEVIRKSDQTTWCTNKTSITFPATSSSYTLIMYATSHAPPPTNGQPMSLKIVWQ